MIKDNLREIALQLGFDLFGVAEVREAVHAGIFRKWLGDGCQAGMEWMERTPERRVNPGEVLPGARSVVILGMGYHPGAEISGPGCGRFARYAWGEDYHGILEEKLSDLSDYLESLGGSQKVYVDAGPVLERDWASAAGLGWCGKSNLLIHPQRGSYTFLASLLTTVDMPADTPMAPRCGFCRRCLDSCPTEALGEGHELDARRCLSYWTIENKGAIPVEFRKVLGNRVYGCDICLEACPWNRKVQVTGEVRFMTRKAFLKKPLRDFLRMTEEEFAVIFRKSPIKRIKLRGLQRNVCVALGNVGDFGDIPALEAMASGGDSLLEEHARWALAEIRRRAGNQW